jgi:hypothetical protein
MIDSVFSIYDLAGLHDRINRLFRLDPRIAVMRRKNRAGFHDNPSYFHLAD